VQKLLLLSVLIATIAIPALAARDPNPRRGVKRAVFFYLAFNLCYLFGLLYIYPRLNPS